MSVGIFLSDDVVQSLPQPVKDALLQELQRRLQGNADQKPKVVEPTTLVDEEKLANLSFVQVNKFLEGCSEKTKNVLKIIVKNKNGNFLLSEIAKALNMTIDDLSGVWGGLTKRTRTILGEKNFKLVTWQNIYQNNKWSDAKGEMSATTYTSFRMALGL